MERNKPSGIPGTGALVAFESAARLGSLSRAARELRTSQPAISIRVAKLEKHLSTQLFERSRTGVTLTDAGERFHEGVSTGLAVIRAAVAELAAWPRGEQVVIACSHEASHFLLMPRYESLRQALGEQVGIRILTYHYDRQHLPLAPVADVVMAWEANLGSEDRVVIHEEAVRPLCSPGYAASPRGCPQRTCQRLGRAHIPRSRTAQRGLGVLGGLVRGRRASAARAPLHRVR